MIFIQTGAMKMLILDPAALRVLEQGRAILSPDKTVGLFYSPAPEWLARKISTAANGNRLDADALRQIWEKAHGSVPRGHVVCFKDRKRDHCDLTNLECISRGELARRNRMWTIYPRDLALAIQMNGALKRKLRRIDHANEEQNVRSAQSSL
jgi:hypothetical protein